MRTLLLVIAASTILPACLPDPVFLFSEKQKERTSSDGFSNEGNEASDLDTNEELPHALSSFVLDGTVIPKDNIEDSHADEYSDEEVSKNYQYFGKNDLSLFCKESKAADELIGYLVVSVESAPTASPDKITESWKQRLSLPCAGRIDLKYWGLTESHTYKFFVEQLALDGKTLKKKLSGSFKTLDPLATTVFEMK